MTTATAPTADQIRDSIDELEAARARLYVLRSALDGGQVDSASAEVVAGDVDDAVNRALGLLRGAKR